MISSKVIEDSISPGGKRLTTLQLCYQRFIHAEFMTHRVFSRNASSSRAIPVAKMIEQVRTNPAMPVHWGANQPGMQAHAELEGAALAEAKAVWRHAANAAADHATHLNALGLHKQVANRILEPFQWIHVIVTATEWQNFFDLRNHADAQPEIHVLANEMQVVMAYSKPTFLNYYQWHLPYVTEGERTRHDPVTLRRISAARCARVSYLTHDGDYPKVDADLALYDRLVGSTPLHASPVEHQATPDRLVQSFVGDESGDMDMTDGWENSILHGNFVGWVQHRKLLGA